MHTAARIGVQALVVGASLGTRAGLAHAQSAANVTRVGADARIAPRDRRSACGDGWQRYGERRSPAGAIALRCDGASVHFDQLSDDRQAQTQPTLGSGGAPVSLTEPLKHMRE